MYKKKDFINKSWTPKSPFSY